MELICVLYRILVPERNTMYGTDEDIFGTLLAPASSKQESSTCIVAEPYCTTIACYDSTQSIASKLIVFEDIMLIQLQSKDNNNTPVISGYTFVENSTKYCCNFTVGKEGGNSCISSFIVLISDSYKTSSNLVTVSIIDHFIASYFGTDLALSKSPVLLYGTCDTSGDIFYTVIRSPDICFMEPKSYFLLSLNQPIVKILSFNMLSINDTETGGADALFFIGREGKICVLFSSGKCSSSKEFLLNVPVYSACFLSHYLLISSYKAIIVINLEYKGSDKEEPCISTFLVEAFCNANILKINSVIRMSNDLARSSVLMAKRNGYLYALNESDLKSQCLPKMGINLQEVVTQIGEVSNEVDILKNSISAVEMCLKQVNIAINLFSNVRVKDENHLAVNCYLFPEMYNQKNGGIRIKLDLECSGSKYPDTTSGWFLSVHMISPKLSFISYFFSVSSFTQGELFSTHLKLFTEDLPSHIFCIVYCDFEYLNFVGARRPIGISTILKKESLNILDFLKEIDSNAFQYSLCNIEGCLPLNKQSWEQLKNALRRNLLLEKFLCEFKSGAMNPQSVLFILHRNNIVNSVYVCRINQDKCVMARLLTNSTTFGCELRAAIVEKLKVNVLRVSY